MLTSALRRSIAAGALAALAIDVWMLAGPHGDLVRDMSPLGAFYDVQGRAFLAGHLAVPAAPVGIEGFQIGGATYLYYGPVLALLRLPVLLATHRLDGRMSALSMVVALIVLLVAAAVVYTRTRRLLRSDAPVDRVEQTLAFVLFLALGAGSVAVYLAAMPVVYEETELWGAALALAALAAIVGLLESPGVRRVAWAGLLTTLAVNTRVSVGLGPVAALGALTVATAAGSFGPRAAVGKGVLAALVLATLVPVATSAAINQAKFDRPFGIPIEKQVASRIGEDRRAALRANGGSIFGPQFAPTVLLSTARPDAIGAVRAFPFVGLPARPPHVVGDVRFDTLQASLSAPTSMPLLCLLTLCGLVGLGRRRSRRPLLVVLLAASTGYLGALTIGYVTTRYLADLLPFLALGGIAGLHLLLARGPSSPLLAGAVVLALAGVGINTATGLVDQRLISPLSAQSDRAAFVHAQNRFDRLLGRRPTGISFARRVPAKAPGRTGDLLVVGPCTGLYVVGSLGTWLPVETASGPSGRRPLCRAITKRSDPRR